MATHQFAKSFCLKFGYLGMQPTRHSISKIFIVIDGLGPKSFLHVRGQMEIRLSQDQAVQRNDQKRHFLNGFIIGGFNAIQIQLSAERDICSEYFFLGFSKSDRVIILPRSMNLTSNIHVVPLKTVTVLWQHAICEIFFVFSSISDLAVRCSTSTPGSLLNHKLHRYSNEALFNNVTFQIALVFTTW